VGREQSQSQRLESEEDLGKEGGREGGVKSEERRRGEGRDLAAIQDRNTATEAERNPVRGGNQSNPRELSITPDVGKI
jgi:hypothetical protein